jgi:hypothetical protein
LKERVAAFAVRHRTRVPGATERRTDTPVSPGHACHVTPKV